MPIHMHVYAAIISTGILDYTHPHPYLKLHILLNGVHILWVVPAYVTSTCMHHTPHMYPISIPGQLGCLS